MKQTDNDLVAKIATIKTKIEEVDELRKKITDILDYERAILDDILGMLLSEYSRR